jgi:hypothetical protein
MRWLQRLAPTKRISQRQGTTVFFHYPCFDGLVSATILSECLETSLGLLVTEFRSVNYDLTPRWLDTELPGHAAVVDFLYHPQSDFWADHHATAFLDNRCREDYENRRSERLLLYDPQSPSCASVLWKALRPELPGEARYAEMVSWADRIDSATYPSVREAVFGSAPAEEINLSLADDDGVGYRDLLLRGMRTRTLDDVASLRPVRDRAARVKKRIERGLRALRDSVKSAPGDIVLFEGSETKDTIISRYSPFLFYPHARYSVGLVRSSNGSKITAMRNPWLEFDSVQLGKIFSGYGGGGHQRVASLLLPRNSPIDPAATLSHIAEEIRMADERKSKVDRDAIA